MNITAIEIEYALSEKFDKRKNILVPNIQEGMGLHECDVLMLRPTGYATEFEIKITKSDLAKDKKKDHGHKSDMIKEMYYAVPYTILSYALGVLNKNYGVIAVRYVNGEPQVEIKREPTLNPEARKWTDEERFNLARLGAMRIWKLKKTVIDLTQKKGLQKQQR